MRDKETAAIALGHARELMIHDSELRVKNFNFFLIIAGAALTAYFNIKDFQVPIALAGMFVGLAFLILDIRGRQLLDTTSTALISAEEALAISPSPIRQEESGRFMAKLISHTFVYRSLYGLAVVVSILALLIP